MDVPARPWYTTDPRAVYTSGKSLWPICQHCPADSQRSRPRVGWRHTWRRQGCLFLLSSGVAASSKHTRTHKITDLRRPKTPGWCVVDWFTVSFCSIICSTCLHSSILSRSTRNSVLLGVRFLYDCCACMLYDVMCVMWCVCLYYVFCLCLWWGGWHVW